MNRSEQRRRGGAETLGWARAALAAVAVVLVIMGLAVGAAHAQQAGEAPFGGFKHDASQPIKVSSDTLQVRNQDQVAIFQGKVDVVQGEVRMRADRLEVTYKGEGGAQQAGAGATPGSGAIDKLVAIGDVLISNGKETAKADRADYDVADGSIVLSGNVILLQGDNIVKGKTLRIDLASGTAKMGGGRVQVSLEPAR